MTETLDQMLRRYVDEDTYSFQGYSKLTVGSLGRELETPLHMACLRGAADDVQLLIDAGADIQAKTDIGVTPLHRAIAGGNPEVVRLLLTAEADPAVPDHFGRTPASMIAEGQLRFDQLAKMASRG